MSGGEQGPVPVPGALSSPVDRGLNPDRASATTTWASVMFVTMFANMVGTTPFFFIGAFGPSIRSDLGIDEFQLGVAAAAFNVGAMVSVFQAGRVGERYGYRRTVVLGCLATVLGMVAGSSSRTFNGLLIALIAAGLGNALVQPAANALLARWVPVSRQGLAFGLKQASIPAAALVAGIGLATLSNGGDWRQVFILGASAPVAAIVLVRRVLPKDNGAEAKVVRVVSGRIFRDLFLFAFAAFLASAAGAAVAAFAAESAISGGLSARSAGLWYVWGAGTGVVARVLWGSVGSRLGHRVFLVAAGLMFLGAFGPFLFAGELSWISQALGTTVNDRRILSAFRASNSERV